MDQTGFIPNHYSSDNIRRLVNLQYLVYDSIHPTIALSLDAAKAFDCVEWTYLFKTLERFGFGQNVITWINNLYNTLLLRYFRTSFLWRGFDGPLAYSFVSMTLQVPGGRIHIVGSTWTRWCLIIKPAFLSGRLSLLPAHGCLVFSYPTSAHHMTHCIHAYMHPHRLLIDDHISSGSEQLGSSVFPMEHMCSQVLLKELGV